MSKSDKKWIDKVRQELTNYSPEYNAADWAALEKLLPVTKGWFGLPKTISNWLKGTLVVIVPTAAILFAYQYKSNTAQSSVNKPDLKSLMVNNSVTQEQLTGLGLMNERIMEPLNELKKETKTKTKVLKNIGKDNNKKLDNRKLDNINTNSRKQSLNNNLVQYENKNKSATYVTHKSVLQVDSVLQSLPNEDSIQTISQATSKSSVKIDSSAITIKNEINKSDFVAIDTIERTTISNTDKKDSNNQTKINNTVKNSNGKVGVKKTNKSSNKRSTTKKHINKKNRTKRNKLRKYYRKIIKTKKPLNNKKTLPLLIGSSFSVEYITKTAPYNPHTGFSGGAVFEKFITNNISLAITLQLFTGSFKYIKTTPADTIIIPNNSNLDDSLNIPNQQIVTTNSPTVILNPETKTEHSLNLLYLNFPVEFNYYILNKRKNRIALTAGISNKYILSISKDGTKQELSNKFYFAQSTTLGVIYNREINRNLNFNIKPFVNIPLYKINPENFSGTSFGVNVNLLFNINKKK